MYLGRVAARSSALVGQVYRLHAALITKLRSPRGLNIELVRRLTLNQVLFSGVQAVPLIAASATLIGGVAIMQTVSLLSGLAYELIGQILVGIIVREIGPLIAAVVLIGRSGTAMATEIGSMRLNGEWDALKAYRIDPVDFVILPRVAGMVASMFCMVVCFDVLGILGGCGMALLMKGISSAQLLSRVGSALTNADLAVTLLKALVFGELVATLSCIYGMRVHGSPTELPRAVTRAVVACMVGVLVLDSLITAAFYIL